MLMINSPCAHEKLPEMEEGVYQGTWRMSSAPFVSLHSSVLPILTMVHSVTKRHALTAARCRAIYVAMLLEATSTLIRCVRPYPIVHSD
jgi:hypothetical protein